MPPRGNTNRRGRGNFKGNHSGNDRDSVLQRLSKSNFQKANLKNNSKQYKYVKTPTVSHSVASLPTDQKIRQITKEFIKKYIKEFDSPGRQNLEPLYNSDAFFSFSATQPMPTTGRNHLECSDPQQRVSMLVHDKTNIAKTLAQFSPTEHIDSQLTIDIPFFIVSPMSVSSMNVVVTGLFKDTSQIPAQQLRAFTRVFLLKHVATDQQGEANYQIFNDILMLQAPSSDQLKKFLQDNQRASNATNPSSTGSTDNLQTKKAREEIIVKTIMDKTRMNRLGTLKLLQDCDWDIDKCMLAFERNMQINGIPQEFFN